MAAVDGYQRLLKSFFNIFQFQLLKREDLLLSFVLHDCKLDLFHRFMLFDGFIDEAEKVTVSLIDDEDNG